MSLKIQCDCYISQETRNKPESQGLWFYKCMENDYQYEPCAIIMKDGYLSISEQGLGETILEHFHNGLTDLTWAT